MIGQAGQWTQTPSATPLQPKKWNAHFVLCSNSGDQLSWLIDSNPICHPSPTKKWNACFCITLYFWWSAGLVDGLKAHPPPLKPKKWNANFCITFNFWWSAGLVNKLELHPLPFSSQKNEMLIFVLHSTSDDWPGWSLDSNPIHLLPQAKKNEMLIFGLCLTSDDQTGWLMNLNPICHPSPAKKMKCSFLDYIQLLMIGRAAQWTWTPSATSFQPKKWNAHFCIMFNFW